MRGSENRSCLVVGAVGAQMPEQSAKRNQVHGLQPLDEHAYDDSLRPELRNSTAC